jgi:hypothetical protein
VFDSVVAAAFQNVKEAHDVTLGINVGVVNGIAYAGLGCEVDDSVEVSLGEDLFNYGAVGYVCFDELECASIRLVAATGRSYMGLDSLQSGLFEVDVVVVAEVVQADDGVSAFEQGKANVAADETGCACDQDFHGGILAFICQQDTQSGLPEYQNRQYFLGSRLKPRFNMNENNRE